MRGFVDSCTEVCDAGAGCGVGGRVCSLWRCSPAQTQHPTEDTATGAPAGGHGVRGRDIVQMGSHTFTTYLHLTLTRRYSSQVPASEPSIAQSNQWQVLALMISINYLHGLLVIINVIEIRISIML